MNGRRSTLLVAGLLLSGEFAWATPPTHHKLFFTAPAERKVFRIEVDVNEASRTPLNLSVTFLRTFPEGSVLSDIAFGPDGNLYVICGVDAICRIDQSGANVGTGTFYSFTNAGDPTGLGGMRVLGNDLYFTAAQGIFRKNVFSPTASVELVTPEALTAAGMTVALTGDLIAAKGGQLFRVRRDGSKNFTQESTLSLGSFFTGTKGVAAEPVLGLTPSIKSNRKVVTGTRTAANGGGDAVGVFVCDPAPGTACALQASLTFALPSGQKARDLEINLAGSSFFATDQGKLYRFDPDATSNKAILLADLSAAEAATSGYGVALPPTSRTDTASFGVGVSTKRVNCGNSLVDLTVDTLAATTAGVTCEMDLPGPLNGQFSGAAAGALCTEYDWNGGFCTLVDVNLSPLPTVPTTFSVAYIKGDEPIPAEPLLVHNLSEVTITNYYLAGALAPQDGTREGRGTSTNVVADRPLDDPSAAFVGFKGKLSSDPGAPTLVNNQVPVRPQFDHSPRSGETLRLSANCLNPDVFVSPVRSVGNANTENFFRPTDNHWQFNLDLQNFPKNQLCVLSIWGNVGPFVQAYIKRK